jgi:hypothetical protein
VIARRAWESYGGQSMVLVHACVTSRRRRQ